MSLADLRAALDAELAATPEYYDFKVLRSEREGALWRVTLEPGYVYAEGQPPGQAAALGLLDDSLDGASAWWGAPVKGHASVLAHEELYARAFVVSSFGKTYHVTGWKTGYVVAPPALSAELRKIHQYVNFCGVTPLQHALADFMASNPEHVEELPAFYQAKRDLFCDLLAGSRFRFTRAPGTYFQLADYSAIRPDLDDVAMAEWLTREHGVAAIPVSVFYQQAPAEMRLVRFCFAKREETLRLAAEKLCAI